MSTTAAPFVKTSSLVIPVAKIHPWPLNPRKLAEADRGILTEAIKSQGQLEEGKVRPHPSIPGDYELVDGECRWWGLQGAGIREMRVQLGDWTNEQMMVIALAAKNPLGPIAQARGVAWFMEQPGATLRGVAAQVGFTYQHVSRLAAVMRGPAEIVKAVEAGKLPLTTACIIVEGVADEKRQLECLHAVVHPENEPGPLSGDRTRRLIESTFGKPLRVPVAVEGTVALSAEENLRVFPEGAVEAAAESGFVCYTRPIPADLLKPEVAAGGGAAVKFADITEGVTVYMAVDGEGAPVQVVKLEEAFAAVTEPTIFRDEAIQQHGLAGDAYIIKAARRGDTPEQIARHLARGQSAEQLAQTVAKVEGVIERSKSGAAAVSASQREVEEQAAREAAKETAAQRKRDRKIVKWLAKLGEAVAADEAWRGLPYWTLEFEAALGLLSEPEIELVLEAEDAEREKGARADVRRDLELHAGALPLGKLAALVMQMQVVALVRAEGLDGQTALAWDAALISAPKPTPPEAVAFAGLPEGEREKLTQLARARAGGMSAPMLAREFKMSLEEVCGALELDYTVERDEWSGMGEALESALGEAGVLPAARPAMIKLAVGRVVPIADLVPEEIKRVSEQLGRVRAAKPKLPTPPRDKEAA